MKVRGSTLAMTSLLLAGTFAVDTPAASEARLLFNGPGKKVIGFMPNGTLLTCVDALQSFFHYDLSKTVDSGPNWKYPAEGKFVSGTLTPDGTKVALVFEVAKEKSQIHLCDSTTGARLKPDFQTTDVGYVAFNNDATKLAGICPMNGTIRLWDVGAGTLLDTLSWADPMQVVWSGVEFSQDGKYIAGRNSYAYALWNLSSRTILGNSRMHDLYLVLNAQWTMALGVLAPSITKAAFPNASLLDVTAPERPSPVHKKMSANLDWIAFSPDGTLAAVATTNSIIRLWNVSVDEPLEPAIPRNAPIINLAISPDNRFLAICEWNPVRGARLSSKSVRLVDIKTGESVSPTQELDGVFPQWLFDKSSRFMVVSALGQTDRVTQIWQLPVAD